MEQLQGVFPAKKKDGSLYFRSSITYRNRHISLGSFQTEQKAHKAYKEAEQNMPTKDTWKPKNFYQISTCG